ncbi:MAG: GspE/PulE family protein [Patescibacteria group bacterium]
MMSPAANTTTVTGKQDLLDVLLSSKAINEGTYKAIREESQRTGQPIELIIEAKKTVREDDLVKAKSLLYNIPFADLFGRLVRAEVLNIIPQELAENYQIVAFNRVGSEVSMAMVNPSDYKALEAIEFIARKNRFKIKYFIATPSALKYVIRQYESLSTEVEEALKGAQAEATKLSPESMTISDKGLEEVVKQAPVSKMVSVILRHAVEGNASDVHIEPVDNETRVRYRVDGILHTSLILPKNIHSALVARIKVVSNLKIDETRIPQDGRFRMTIGDHNIDYRVSTLPLVNHEKVVMRILDTSQNIIDLASLGFAGAGLAAMKKGISKSHGMFLITGPTGSGKSTTLYALIQILNKEGVNIVTLEDPVEYFMSGVNQSQVNPEVGLTFAAGLRSILRQDPDIIMVGEIRDKETAELAVHASLTGHIVLSTLHTNDAFGAIPRMMDMGIEPFLITSSVNVVMAQRLVRRVCQHCRYQIPLPEQVANEVMAELDKIPKDHRPTDINFTPPLKVYKGRGCPRCETTGYKGRVAISEVLVMSPQLQKIIIEGKDIIDKSVEEFNRQGMFSMRQDGAIKSLQGHTTIEEVWNATRA